MQFLKNLSLTALLGASFFGSHQANAHTDSTYITPFERSGGRQTATYRESIDFYTALQQSCKAIKVKKIGEADGNNPLYVVYYSPTNDFSPTNWHKEGKLIMFINNGIHPGEPDGIDASMMLLRDAAQGKITIPGNVVLAVIPVFNVGGALNRSSTSRANQNGPESYGFRGNAQNLDLNRDFIKADASETRALEAEFTRLDPDIFIDNHVSDGADYQHVMTLLPTQHDKLGGKCGSYMYETFTPMVYKEMKKKGYDMVPYVNNFDNTPEKGWREFFESPRFASGYAALFQTMGYVVETHMLKPFKDRVWATYDIMNSMIMLSAQNATKIHEVRAGDRNAIINQKQYTIDWQIDTTRFDWVEFKGYESAYKPSLVSGLPRLYYDHQKPFTRKVPFYDHYNPKETVKAPVAYIVPAAWKGVISRLKRNGIQMHTLERDTTFNVTAYHIDRYESGNQPYEKHYLHRNIKVTPETATIGFHKGDVWINVNQPANRYIVETLEPAAPDGFLAWNFFDGILQQKEYFGDYVFEDLAAEIVQNDPALKKALEEKQKSDSAFAKNAGAQLDFVYRHSKYFEPTVLRFPVCRVEAD